MGSNVNDANIVHPLYSKLFWDWEFWRLAYQGGREYLNKHLRQHQKELPLYYRDRVERGVYPNIIRNVVDTYTAHIFHEAVVRDPDLDEFHDDINLQGLPADEFYAEVLTAAEIYGSCGVLTDRFEPDPDASPVTRAQEQEMGIRPYGVILTPPDIIDWDTDRFGRLRWLIHVERSDDGREPLDKQTTPTERFKLWTPTEWKALELRKGEEKDAVAAFVIVDEGTHPVGRVPVQFIYYGRRFGTHPLGESAIKDLAPMARRVCNLLSLIDEQAYQHVFNILAVPDAMFSELSKMNFSVAGSVSFPDSATHKPFYLAPEISQLTVLRAELTETMREVRILSGLGRQNEDSRAAVSGRSMAFQTMDKTALLNKLSERMAALEHQVDLDAVAWMDSNAEPAPPGYDTDFDPEAVGMQLDEALLFDSFGIGGIAKRETLIAAARNYLGPKVEPEVLAEVVEDIKARFTPAPEAEDDLPAGLGGMLVEDVAEGTLNGAQVREMVNILESVSAGTMATASAIGVFVQAFGMEPEAARALIAPAEDIEPPAENQPPPATPPVPEPPPEPPQN